MHAHGQKAPKSGQERSKTTPRLPQEHPKRPRKLPKGSPRPPEDFPKSTPDPPRALQETSRTSQDAPKISQDTPNSPKLHCRSASSSHETGDSETSTSVVRPQEPATSACAINLATLLFPSPSVRTPAWGRRSSRAARSRSAAPTAGGKRFVNQSSKASFRSLLQVALEGSQLTK